MGGWAIVRAGDGVVTVEDLVQAYDVSLHPEVIRGRLKPEEALQDFMENFEVGGTGKTKGDGQVTWIEFLAYYRVSVLSTSPLTPDGFDDPTR